MKKRIAAALTACLLLGTGGYAIEPSEIVSEANFYTGTLYYCDATRNKVVLKNVKPMGTMNEKSRKTAAEAEFQELDLLGEVQVEDGSTVDAEICNRFADSNVRALIVRSEAKGLQVVTLKFM